MTDTLTTPHPNVTIRKQAERIDALIRTIEAGELAHTDEIRQMRHALTLALDQLAEERAANHRLTQVIRHLRSITKETA